MPEAKEPLKFPCKNHRKYIPDLCKDCEQGVTEELDRMIADLSEEVNVRKARRHYGK